MAARTENLLTTGPDHCYSLPVSDMLDVVGQMRRLDGKRTALFEMLQDFEKAQETPT